ncbi:E3 ubiquitin-protein ligase EL5-like [Oryza glaberrima]|uniref:RING-type E3 ubiquitin transferase n=1 Tax=Oryza glaberrima TaxID=4538 RepID=I1NZ03_ORYGL|nr:E3 ubiquitin-protein ligase EL5-like [Oryza glaberrima]
MSLSSSSNSLPYSTDQGGYSTHDTLVLLGIGFFATAVSVLMIVLCECLCCRRRRRGGGGGTVVYVAARPFFLGGGGDSGGGLSASAVATLPSFVYRREEWAEAAPRGDGSGSGRGGGGGWAQCAVCLSIVQEGETVRQLPACKHLFHVGCIDMWLHSHSTCPLCRASVEPLGKETPLKDQAPPV